ncbi:hypothetical protein K7472_16800 [Streptomyces sp. PTM05]|uniref:Uncharacterized protein n=1 Tax=Streptantibioticus parmotrematis TaxID=2873249 RepID=A0ABS7QTI6_9ACTN|nr:hypothetical protein [Streptantibioticus parmotrematis]MBY8886512.1 hypothetical protein [Streptantibioticus parmotrematis]
MNGLFDAGTPRFTAEVQRYAYVPEGGGDVHAVVTVTSRDDEGGTGVPGGGAGLAGLMLRLWTPRGARVRWLRQVAPVAEDLTGRREETGPRTGDYPVGRWDRRARAYDLQVRVPPVGAGQEMLAARLSLLRPSPDRDEPPQVLCQALVRAVWAGTRPEADRTAKLLATVDGRGDEGRAADGTVRLRREVADTGRPAPQTRSVVTVRVRK